MIDTSPFKLLFIVMFVRLVQIAYQTHKFTDVVSYIAKLKKKKKKERNQLNVNINTKAK